MIYFNGMYHIFDQKNASNINLKQINWGHFESKDLVSWTERSLLFLLIKAMIVLVSGRAVRSLMMKESLRLFILAEAGVIPSMPLFLRIHV